MTEPDPTPMPGARREGQAFTFRRLTGEHVPLLHAWLHRPHVREWWQEPSTPEELEEDYLTPETAGEATRAHIAYLGEAPIGFIQSYVVKGSGDGWWEDEDDPGARGIDQFLADAESLGRGMGRAMIRAFVDHLFADPAVTKVQTDPSPANERAIRCYRAAGFADVGVVETPDGPALLMVRGRA